MSLLLRKRFPPGILFGSLHRYLTNQCRALQRFVDDGHLAIGNKRAENQLRVVAVAERIGCSPAASMARRTALLCSLVQRCKLVNVPAFEYLKPEWPHTRIASSASSHPKAGR